LWERAAPQERALPLWERALPLWERALPLWERALRATAFREHMQDVAKRCRAQGALPQRHGHCR